MIPICARPTIGPFDVVLSCASSLRRPVSRYQTRARLEDLNSVLRCGHDATFKKSRNHQPGFAPRGFPIARTAEIHCRFRRSKKPTRTKLSSRVLLKNVIPWVKEPTQMSLNSLPLSSIQFTSSGQSLAPDFLRSLEIGGMVSRSGKNDAIRSEITDTKTVVLRRLERWPPEKRARAVCRLTADGYNEGVRDGLEDHVVSS